MIYPEDLRYTETHEWCRMEGSTAVVGITDKAQDLMGDIVFVQMPEAGEEVTAAEAFGELESIKSVAEMFSPVTGTIAEVNEELAGKPQLLNKDPYGAWVLRVEDAVEGDLMSAEEYMAFIEETEK